MPATPSFAKLYDKLPARRGGYGLDVAERNIADFEQKFPHPVPRPYLEFVRHFGTGPLLVKDDPTPWYVLLPAISQDVEALVAKDLTGAAGQVILKAIAAFGALTTGTFTAMFVETCAEEPVRTADGRLIGRIGAMAILPMFEHPRFTLFWMWPTLPSSDDLDAVMAADIMDEPLYLDGADEDLSVDADEDLSVDADEDTPPGAPSEEDDPFCSGPQVVVFLKTHGRFLVIGADFSDALAFLTLDERPDAMEEIFAPLAAKAAGIRKHMDRALASVEPLAAPTSA